jgi:hypothetical protein
MTCVGTIGDKDASGDNYYGQYICWQEFVDYAWDVYGFEGNKAYWDEGWGWEDCCNTDLPLARTFNGCFLLTYSAPDYLNDSYDACCLNWARRYVRGHIDDLETECTTDFVAKAFWGCNVDDRVELGLPFFNSCAVPVRASTLLHEARHMGGKDHNANFPPGSVYGAGQSGADSSWDYEGAWMYEALYLWWFYVDGTLTTTAMKESARQEGNIIIDNAFATHPGFSI